MPETMCNGGKRTVAVAGFVARNFQVCEQGCLYGLAWVYRLMGRGSGCLGEGEVGFFSGIQGNGLPSYGTFIPLQYFFLRQHEALFL